MPNRQYILPVSSSSGSGSGGGGVSSFTGDGTLITNSGSTGAVVTTIGTLPATKGGVLQQSTPSVGQYDMLPFGDGAYVAMATVGTQMDGTVNRCRFQLFNYHDIITFSRATINVTTSANGNNIFVGIYNSALTSLLGQWTFPLTAATGTYTAVLAASATLTLTPGLYGLVWASDATTPVVSGFATDQTTWFTPINLNFTRNGQGANTAGAKVSGGVMPANLGTVVAAGVRAPNILIEIS